MRRVTFGRALSYLSAAFQVRRAGFTRLAVLSRDFHPYAHLKSVGIGSLSNNSRVLSIAISSIPIAPLCVPPASADDCIDAGDLVAAGSQDALRLHDDDGGRDGVEMHDDCRSHEDVKSLDDRSSPSLDKMLDVLAFLRETLDNERGTLCAGILSVNLFVHGLFLIADRFFTTSLSPFLWRNFVLSLENLQGRRWHVLVTCMFTHIHTPHFLLNSASMVMMFALAISQANVPQWQWASLYLSGGIACSLASLLSVKMTKGPRHHKAQGSSGAIAAMATYLVLTYPDPGGWAIIYAKTLTWILAIRSAWGTMRFLKTGTNKKRMIGHAGHLGGYVWGILISLVASTDIFTSSSNITENGGLDND